MTPVAYAQQHADRFVDELKDFLRIPSVSTDAAHAADVQRAADWLAAHLDGLGIQHTEVIPTKGHPIVYAEHTVGESAPTVLVYGHYDVQPPDPLDLWTTPPFEPTERDGKLYGRGTCDDKGQVFMYPKAIESYLATDTPLPVNLKIVVEGEEENGSTHLGQFLEENAEKLAADYLIISDTGFLAEGVPSITYGLRGLAYVEVTLEGPDRDLHSGAYGGGIENPVNALAAMIADLHDDDHRVTIDGFYDDVLPLTDDERATFADLPFDDQKWAEEVGANEPKTEAGYTTFEGITARPTLDVNGIWGGYTGEGAKTVLPARASAKISTRLVPNQTPQDITKKLQRHFETHVPPTMKLTFTDLHGGEGVLVDTDGPAMQAASDAMEEVFGKAPVFVRGGGSIPVVAGFKRILGLDAVLLGVGLDSDSIHSPNEHFGLDRFHGGIATLIGFFDRVAKV